MKELYYMLDFSALMCYFEIRVNDVEVFAFNVDGQTSADMPINQGILESGDCTIEVKAFPLKGTTELHKDAYVRYKVVGFDVSSGDFVFVNQFENHQTPPVQKGIPISIHRSSFRAEVPYKLDAWQNSINLKETNFDIKLKLIETYNKIGENINNGNYDNFIEMFTKKENNIAKALYLDEDEKKQRITKLVSDFQSGFKTQPIPKDVFVEYSAYGKLACLKRINGMSALFLENEETEEELILDVKFHIPNGKTEFEII